MQNYTLTAEEYKVKKEAERTELLKQLERGVQAIFSSEKYTEFLKAYAKFHHYSIGNTIMILTQKPDAGKVASYTTWKNLGRHIKKGEKGIKIIVPAPYKFEKQMSPEDSEPLELSGLAFRVGHVYDQSQTEGRSLPSLATNLTENSSDIKQAIDQLIDSSDIPIYFNKPINQGSNGYYHITDKYIALKSDLSDTQCFKTLVHELTHAKLHANVDDRFSAFEREVQAESVAYIVCHKYGIDTSEYSFGYIAGWSSDKDIKELKASLDTIGKCSSELIDKIDSALGINERKPHKKAAQSYER